MNIFMLLCDSPKAPLQSWPIFLCYVSNICLITHDDLMRAAVRVSSSKSSPRRCRWWRVYVIPWDRWAEPSNGTLPLTASYGTRPPCSCRIRDESIRSFLSPDRQNTPLPLRIVFYCTVTIWRLNRWQDPRLIPLHTQQTANEECSSNNRDPSLWQGSSTKLPKI